MKASFGKKKVLAKEKTRGEPRSSILSSIFEEQVARRQIPRQIGGETSDSEASQASEINMQPAQKRWAHSEIIVLQNEGSGFGFGIVGGKATGVRTKTILPNGQADRDGRLQSGDTILKINDIDLSGMGSKQAATILQETGTTVKLEIARGELLTFNQLKTSPDVVFDVKLTKNGGGIGIHIAGWVNDGSSGSTQHGIYVKAVMPGSPAANDGRIEAGDQIIAINGLRLDEQGVGSEEAVEALQNTGDSVHLTLSRRKREYSNEIFADANRNGVVKNSEPDRLTQEVEKPSKLMTAMLNASSIFSQMESQTDETIFGDKLLALANQVKKKEDETKALYSQNARNMTEIKNKIAKLESKYKKLQSQKFAVEQAYSTLKEENEIQKKTIEELTSKVDGLLSIKSEHERMSKMFGDFSVQFMETRGLSPSCKICHEIYDTNLHFQVSLKDCGHTFGEDCIKQTLEQTGRCPVCNRKKTIADISRVY